MEAVAVLQKIRQQGFVIKAEGAQISLSPKLLINDKMISFIRKHKQALLTALYQEQDKHKALHLERKRALRSGRLEIFRILLRRFLNDPKCRDMVNYKGSLPINDKAVADYLDMELLNFDYDIEATIDIYRIYTPIGDPSTITCAKCGYNPQFCSCGTVPVGMVACDACEHFTPDQIGDGGGIGTCGVQIKSTQEINGRMPLYRYAHRHCDKFSKLMS
jgi:hypothetical protein